MRQTIGIAAVIVSSLLVTSGGAIPRLDGGQPLAEVTLVRGDDWRVVNERLD